MPKWVIPRIISAVLLCSIFVVPVLGCGKKVASSAGEASSTSKSKSAAAPVETIKPDPFPPLPEEKSAMSSIEAGREPVEAAPSGSSAPGGGEPALPPAGLSPRGVEPATSPSGEASGLGDIFFDFDQHTIRRDAEAILSANAAWITSTTGKAIVIEGHCDERGSQAYNLVLGDKRARSAKRYLEDLGVPASRLKTTSYGELRPFCKEHDESCYQQNRRAHFGTQ
jgi:peptidoglycan-associated lipoprotein